MLSRVANSLYWTCRYVERAENVARFLGVNFHLLLDLPSEEEYQWKPMVQVTGDQEEFETRYSGYTRENVIRFLTFDRENPNSIVSCLRAARENARSIREIISSEIWTHLNQFYLDLLVAECRTFPFDDPQKFFNTIKNGCHMFTGVLYTTMSHGEAWHFSRLGLMLERADKTSRVVDVKYFLLLPHVDYVGMPYDNIQWMAVLKSASALEMYRKRFRRITPQQVMSFLMFDGHFPRSMRYCVGKAEESVHQITGTPLGTVSTQAERVMGRLRADLDYSDIDEVVSTGVHEFLDRFQARLNRVDDAVNGSFFQLKAPRDRTTLGGGISAATLRQ